MAPCLVPLLPLAAIVAEISGVRFATQLAQLVNLLVVVDLLLLGVGYQLEARMKDTCETGINKAQ